MLAYTLEGEKEEDALAVRCPPSHLAPGSITKVHRDTAVGWPGWDELPLTNT